MKSSRSTLSVTLATFNEEVSLEACLRSIKSIANEIIVVDGQSTDRTVEIAKKYKAKVISTTNKANFHINKIMANAKARGEWVLQLDADEIVTTKLCREIEMLLDKKEFGEDSWLSPAKVAINRYIPIFRQPKQLQNATDAYWLKRKNFFLDRFLSHTGQYPDPVIRLFKNGRAKLPGRDVHEQMTVSGTVGWLVNDLEHIATPEFSRYLVRENRYSSLEAEKLLAKGVKVSIANTLYYLLLLPFVVFLRLYIRYLGFLDGFPGFVFSLFSGLHYSLAYIKLWQKYEN